MKKDRGILFHLSNGFLSNKFFFCVHVKRDGGLVNKQTMKFFFLPE